MLAQESLKSSSLFIESIEIRDFKSFAGTTTIGPFHEHLTAIVGANGSGKSNIIDSVCFVFGKRANQLRHKNLQSIIHSSKDYKPYSAKVTINFIVKSTNEEENINKFTVSREVFKEGNNKYFIDNVHVNQQKVIELFASFGVDLQYNRFLVLQGEVEAIALLPCKNTDNKDGLLELCENLIGTTKYIEQINLLTTELGEIQNSVADSESNLQNHKQLLKIMLPKLEQATKFIKGQKTILSCKAHLVIGDKFKNNSELTIAYENIKKVKEQETIMQDKSFKITEKLAKLNEELYLLRRDQQTNLHQKKILLESKKNYALNIERLKNQRLDLINKLDEYENKLKSTQSTIAELINENQLFASKMSQASTTSIKLENALANTRAQKELIDKEFLPMIEEMNAKLAQLMERKQLLDVEFMKHNNKYKYYVKEKELLISDINSSTTAIELLKTQINKFRENITKKAREVDELYIKKTGCEQHSEQLNKKINDIKMSLKTSEDRRKELLDSLRVSSMNRSVIRNKRLYSLLSKEFDSPTSNLKGLGILLLDQINVDVNKFGHALTSAGFAEEIIITEDVIAAEKIVAFVKQRKAGRVTCLIKSKLMQKGEDIKRKYYELKEKGQFNFNISQAKLLIQEINIMDKDIELLLWYKLGYTVLSYGSFEEAKQLALGSQTRYKVVTLKGEVIDRSGIMTGGLSLNYLHLRLQHTPINENAINQVRKELDLCENQISSYQKLLNDLVHEKEYENRNLINDIKISMNTKIEEGKILEQGLHDAKKALKNKLLKVQDEDQKENCQKLKLCTAEIETIKAILDQLNGEKVKLSTLISKIDEEKNKLGGDKRIAIVKHENDIISELKLIDELNLNGSSIIEINKQKIHKLQSDDIIELDEAIKLAKDNLERIDMLITKSEEDIRVAETKLNTLPKNDEIENAITNKLEDQQLVMNEKTAIDNEINSIYANIGEIDKEIKEKIGNMNALNAKYEQLCELFQSLPKINDLNDYELIMNNNYSKLQFETNIADSLMNQNVVHSTNSILASNNVNISTNITEPSVVQEADTNFTNDDIGYMYYSVGFPDYNTTEVYTEEMIKQFQQELARAEANNPPTTMISLDIINEYRDKRDIILKLKNQYIDRRNKLLQITDEVEEIKAQRLTLFEQGFYKIAHKVKELYQMLTNGGDADLEYKSADPFAEGIIYTVRPPGKSWRPLSNLSGGEKTLSSLALILALHHFKPNPFYFLDEIDAALDTNNVILIATYISTIQSLCNQSIVITQRHEFFQMANKLIGVVKIQNKTKTYTLEPELILED